MNTERYDVYKTTQNAVACYADAYYDMENYLQILSDKIMSLDEAGH